MRILYFDLDSVRADHLGVYGYNRETSPVIDSLASSSVVFNNCFVSDAPCLPSRAALFSARPGISNGVISHEWPGCHFRIPGNPGMARYDKNYTMPMRLLQENGYHTFTSSIFAQRHMAFWFNAGFSEVSNPTHPCTSEHTDTVVPRVSKWIRENIHDHPNLFMHINFWDAHTPYHPDPDCHARVSKHPLPAFPDEDTIADHHQNFYGPKSARDIMIRRKPDYKSNTPWMPDEISDCATFKKMCDSYDACIATTDQGIGQIIELLKNEGVYEDTAIIISADHGEAIGQMGMYFEHGVAVDGVCQVPLIIHWPGITDQGGSCNAMIYQYDFMATLIELLNIQKPKLWDAQSFAPALSNKSFTHRDHVIYGCGIFSLQRAVRTQTHAYVRTFHPGCSPLDATYLFDVQTDPNQSQNIASDYPDRVAQMESIYSEWWHGWCTGPNAVTDPLHAQIPTFEYFPEQEMFQRLQYLGRQDQIDDLNNRLASIRSKSRADSISDSRY